MKPINQWEPDPNNTFMIWDMVANQICSEAVSADAIKFVYDMKTFEKIRGPHQVIVEFPRILGINLHTFKLFPQVTMFEGMERWQKRIANDVQEIETSC